MRRARSNVPRLVLVVVAVIVGAVMPASASADPFATFGGFGSPNGPLGGQPTTARGVAVNQSGNGAPAGTVYVAEGNPNHRISQFSASGQFVRAWGFDVVRSGEHNTGANEVQTLTVTASGGKFAVTFGGQTTGATGTGSWIAGASTITVNSTTNGGFAVGQAITTGNGTGIQVDTEIVAISG